MKKIIKLLLIFSLIYCTMPVYAACPINKKGEITGAACTIESVNKAGKNKNIFEIFNQKTKYKDLRPIKENKNKTLIDLLEYNKNCPFGCMPLDKIRPEF